MDTANDAQRKKWLLNFFKSKVREFDFYLRRIIELCDRSLATFRSAKPHSEQDQKEVVFMFSALVNTIQTLKDSGSVFLKEKISWSDFAGMRHGDFFASSRNAATHDGHPIVTGWADGHYLVPNDIHRIGARGEIIKIVAPAEDVRQFCLEFSRDFTSFLLSRVRALGPMEGGLLSYSDLEQASQSHHVPEFARQLIRDQRSEIEAHIATVKHDVATDIIAALTEVMEFCDESLGAGGKSVASAQAQ